MTNTEIHKTIVTIFASIMKIPSEAVDTSADLVEHYGVDSLRAVKLLSTLEVELDLEFPEEDMRLIKTLNDVQNLTEARLLAPKLT